jgi:hypothetical protein
MSSDESGDGLIGALMANCMKLSTLDDAAVVARIVRSQAGPFLAAAFPLVPSRQRRDGGRLWQVGSSRGNEDLLNNPTYETWRTTEVANVEDWMDRALRHTYPQKEGREGVSESITLTLHYRPPWWSEAVVTTDLELSFHGHDRLAVVSLGVVGFGPGKAWEGNLPSRPLPDLVFQPGVPQGPHLNRYAKELMELTAKAFPRAGADFGFVGRFPLQLGPEHYYRRPMEVLRLSWVNLFGPPFVERWGRDALLDAPGFRTAEIGEDCILHQATEDLILQEDPDPPWYEVLGYFRRVTGLDVRVDYVVRPDLFEPTE